MEHFLSIIFVPIDPS